MDLAWLSLGALVVAMIVSCVTELNVGVLGLALAWIVGVYAGGMGLNDVLSGFPTQLFLTLSGVTLLFTQAQLNGTLDRVAHAAVRVCRGNVGLMPVMCFALAGLIATAGPGNVATASMMAPMAMAVAGRAGIPPFLMAIMGGHRAPGRRAFPRRAHRNHRHRHHEQDRPRRIRAADLRGQFPGARPGGFRRLLPVRRLEAVHVPLRKRPGAIRSRLRNDPRPLDHAR